MLSYTLAVSNAEAILLFFYMPRFIQLISTLMFTLCPSASLLRVLMSRSLKIVIVLPLLSSVRDEVLFWVVTSDSAGAGCGYCLMYVLKQP